MTRYVCLIGTALCVLVWCESTNAQNKEPNLISRALKGKKTQRSNNTFRASIFKPLQHINPTSRSKSLARNTAFLRVDRPSVDLLREKDSPLLELTIPFEGSDLVLDLFAESPVAEHFKVRTSDGAEIHPSPGLHYRGTIKGDNQSIAAISIYEGEVLGMISTSSYGDIVIGKWPEYGEDHVIYREDDLIQDQDFSCSALLPPGQEFEAVEKKTSRSEEGKCVDVYMEATYNVYQNKGGNNQVINFIGGIFNQVATIYANENLTVRISELFIWTNPDPYDHGSSPDALSSFMDERPHFNGDVGQLIDMTGNGNGGRAYINVICSNTHNVGYCDLFSSYSNFPTYSWSVNVVTHELGHNLGAYHTQDCIWGPDNCTAIDGCAPSNVTVGCGTCEDPGVPSKGTIMSYCHLENGIDFNLGFGPEPGDVIRARVNAASCLSSCSGGSNGCNLVITDIEITNATCGNDNGKLTVQIEGSSGNVTYDIGDGPQSSNTFTGLALGTYTVVVNNGISCERQMTASVAMTSQAPALGIIVTNTSCHGDDGVIELEGSGGLAPYSYRVGSTTKSNPIFTGLAAGDYTAIVTDNAGCSTSKELTVFTEQSPVLSAAIQHTSCGQENGTIQLTAENAVEPLNFTVGTTTSTSGLFEQLSPGSHQATVTDDNGCTEQIEVSVNSSQPIEASLEIVNTECGKQNGSIFINASGGSGVVSYILGQEISDSPTFANLAAGNYVATVADTAGCEVILEASVATSDSLALQVDATMTSCGLQNGRIALEASGGAGSKIFKINDGEFSTANVFADLKGGTYTVAVQDENQCKIEQIVHISESTPLVLSLQSFNTRCGRSNGQIHLRAQGGTEPYRYMINDQQTIQKTILEDLSPGKYEVVVADSMSCTDQSIIEIKESIAPTLEYETNPASCDKENGRIELTGRGGQTPYQFSLGQGFDVSGSYANVDTGTYLAILKDASDCLDTINVVVGYDDQYKAPLLPDQSPICDGALAILNTGLLSDQDVHWTFNENKMPVTAATLEARNPGIYEATVIYHPQCTLSARTSVESRPNPVVQLDTDISLCQGDTYVLKNVDPDYTYYWSNQASGPEVAFANSGLYSLEVTNKHFCSVELPVNVSIIEPVALQSSQTNLQICQGHEVQLAVQGADEYSWTSDDPTFNATTVSDPIVTPEEDRTYTVVGRNECFFDTLDFTVRLYENNLAVVQDTQIIEGSPLQLSVDGGTEFQWTSTSHLLDCVDCERPTLRPERSGIVNVSYTDRNGCLWEDQIDITVVPLSQVIPPLTNIISPNNDGKNDKLVFEGIERFQGARLEIFNQDGNLIYQDRAYENDWQGEISQGHLPEGVYFYMLTLLLDDRTFRFDSDLTLIRD